MKVHTMTKGGYDTSFFINAVDEGLSLLGESGKKATYYYLERDHHVKKDEVAEKIQVFSDAMDKMFGSGAAFIKTLIVKRLCQQSGGSLPEGFDPADFVKYVTVGS